MANLSLHTKWTPDANLRKGLTTFRALPLSLSVCVQNLFFSPNDPMASTKRDLLEEDDLERDGKKAKVEQTVPDPDVLGPIPELLKQRVVLNAADCDLGLEL